MLSCEAVSDHAAESVSLTRVDGECVCRASDRVAVERALEVQLDQVPFAVVMRTPGDDDALARGFLFSERVVSDPSDIVTVRMVSDDVVGVQLSAAASARLAAGQERRRNVAMNASCGMCGRPSLSALAIDAPVLRAGWAVSRQVLVAMGSTLVSAQPAFRATGGLHAAVLAAVDGTVVDVAEDVGRHNAVDKVIGRAFGAGRLPLHDRLLLVSGRTSFEIVQKAWLAGIPIVASVSAPSSLAIETAQEAGMTLVGFLRGDRFNVYSHDARIR